jgi:hypothetical protein
VVETVSRVVGRGSIHLLSALQERCIVPVCKCTDSGALVSGFSTIRTLMSGDPRFTSYTRGVSKSFIHSVDLYLSRDSRRLPGLSTSKQDVMLQCTESVPHITKTSMHVYRYIHPTCTHARTHAHTNTFSLSLSHVCTCTDTPIPLVHTHKHLLCISLSHTHTYTHTHNICMLGLF